ncbi:hypothetical protein LAZ29_01755 [Cereibacter sphaeroides]|uniref:hypothetical protein n=1 Tax=Cereibacter sphaeroides TaxID=1063 RepID=UPI001F486594|nr:hypothetical protein [Cereibacter sphaeroides]MCE6949659.1 hypothetical protein [Cereibacter sphaeroides]
MPPKHLLLLLWLAFIGVAAWTLTGYWQHGTITTRALAEGEGAGLPVLDPDGHLLGHVRDAGLPKSVAIERSDAAGVPGGLVNVARDALDILEPKGGKAWIVFQGSRGDLDRLPPPSGETLQASEALEPPARPSTLTFTNSVEVVAGSESQSPPTEATVAPQGGREQLLQDQLRPASLAHNLPQRMVYGQTVRVELALSPERSGIDAVSQLQNRIGATLVEDIQHSLRMEAVLSGDGFRIEQSGTAARTILGDRSEVWTWHVTPESFGTRMLDLEVFAVLETSGENLPPTRIRSFATTVDVDIDRFDQVKLFLNETPLIQQVLLVILGGLGSTMGTVMVWLKLFRSRAAGSIPQMRKYAKRK